MTLSTSMQNSGHLFSRITTDAMLWWYLRFLPIALATRKI